MTLPESITPEYTNLPPAGRRPWAVSEIIAWAVVLLLAGLTAVGAALEQRRNAGVAVKGGSITFLTQYLVGAHEATKGGAMPGGATEAQLMQQVEEAARTPEDKVRVAIASGELLGREEGLKRMDALTDPETAEDAAAARAILAGEDVPEEALAAFRKKYEWFADLALSVGKPAGDPIRERMLGAAAGTMWTILGVVAGGIGAAVIGLGLLVLAIVLLSLGRIKRAFRNTLGTGVQPEDRRSYVQGFAWYIAGMVLFSLLLHYVVKFTLHSSSPMVAAGTEIGGMGLAFSTGICWPLFMGQSFAQWRAALGLHAGRGVLREMGSGLLGYLAGLPLIGAGLVATALLVKLSGLSGSHPITEELTMGFDWIVLIFLLASVWAPLTEELMFRGALFAHMRERYGWWISAPVVAVVFAIIHPQGWVALPALAAIAIVLAAIREWRGSIIGCVTAHALHNTLTLGVALVVMRGM